MVETIKFPNAVGCDIERAKAMISQKMGSNYYFYRVVRHSSNKKKSSQINPSQQLNEIILFIDDKFNCIAKTPTWSGVFSNISHNDRYKHFAEEDYEEEEYQ